MDFSCLMASTAIAMDKLQDRRKQCSITLCDINYALELGIIIRWLRVVRTFFLCSTTLANNVELRIEANNYDAVTRMKEKRSRMGKGLRSLSVRVEGVVRRILDDCTPDEHLDLQYGLKFLEEEMDMWFGRLSGYLQQYSTSPELNQIKVIADSVLENLKDYLSTKNAFDYRFLEQTQLMNSLVKKITFLRNFVRFGTLVCAENQEFQSSLTRIELLAISAAHFTMHLFSNARGQISHPNGLTNTVVDNLFLHELYTPALVSLKHSQESSNSLTLDLNEYPFVIVMQDFVNSLLSTIWEMLHLNTGPVVSLKDKLKTVYGGLRFLRTILKNQPDRFDIDKIRAITVAAICDAGVIIFSLDRKDFVIDHTDQEFSENIEVIRLEFEGHVVKTNFPHTDLLGFLDFLLEDYMTEVKGSQVDSDILSFVPKIQESLVFLKSFVGIFLELGNQLKNSHQDLWNLALKVAYKIEFLMDQLVLGDILASFSRSLQSITEDIEIMKADSLKGFCEGGQGIIKVQEIPCTSTDKVVAVVGMPGLGKTTLATKVYSNTSVSHHFHAKAWCSISQVFDRRKVLLEFLNQIQPRESNPTLSEEDLSKQLWRSLRKRRYLIFLDDIWDSEAFELLRGSLPDDSNQSRILLTSRHGDVVPEAILDEKLIFLPLLTVDESLKLLQKKLFPARKDWPPALHEYGMEIAEHCKGLPLSVVIMAGLLKTTDEEIWKDVLKSLRSGVISTIDPCINTIELSYKHLPDHLKPCFLWFGAFPEDHEYSVKRMIWLWIADGLVRKSESKSLEEVARDYMNILISRSLVMNAKRRSAGGVKTCRIHDLLHDFCLRKANEEFFLHLLKVDANGDQKQLSSDDEFETSCFDEHELLYFAELRNLRRLCMYSNPENLKWEVLSPRLQSLLFFGLKSCGRKPDVSVIVRMFKLLRVLDFGEVKLTCLQSGVLVQLRYLAIHVDDFVCPAIGNLSNLEILILNVRIGVKVVKLPDTLWNLQKLRHLCTEKTYWKSEFELPTDSSCNLVQLETLNIPLTSLHGKGWSIMKKQLRKFPNIRRLRCVLDVHSDRPENDTKVVDLSFLSQLESLFLSQEWPYDTISEVVFPENIKRLTLLECKFPWSKISSIAKLPHLAVLKLLRESFYGKTWHVEEGEFPELKFLVLQSWDLVKWTAASNDQFPNLEKLVLIGCPLEEIPECLENVATLEMIEVFDCPDEVVSLVKKVEKFQKNMGNSVLQVHTPFFDDSTDEVLTKKRKELAHHVPLFTSDSYFQCCVSSAESWCQ